MATRKKRVLFVSEAVTLSHVMRPLQLAESLAGDRYEIYFALDPRHKSLLRGLKGSFIPIQSTSPQTFLRRLATGEPLFDPLFLRDSAAADRLLIRGLKPDLVIADLRWGAVLAGRLEGVPTATITNAYLRPDGNEELVLPHHALLSLLGREGAQKIFQRIRPLAFAAHALPMNMVRWWNGAPTLPWDVRHVHCAGDFTLYADIPHLYPELRLAKNELFVGPLARTPSSSLPSWWDEREPGRNAVYVNMGSSGSTSALKPICAAIEKIGARAIVATAGKKVKPGSLGRHVRTADYLPNDLAAERCRLTIYNGGSSGGYLALQGGTPLLGICHHFDTGMFMEKIRQRGAGDWLAPYEISVSAVAEKMAELLRQPPRSAAKELQLACRSFPVKERFRAWIKSVV
jgi:UDP:flavonoid glycosyltransferase YjiC (YdhE family)